MDTEKADPSEAEALADLLLEDVDDEVEEAYYLAPPLVLTWRKFRKHNLAVISAVVLLILYLLVLFAEFISPHSPHERHVEYAQAPPQRLRFIDSEGRFHLQPFVYGTEQQMDEMFIRTYPPITDEIYPVRLFVRGAPYKMWNFLRTDVHLFGADPEAPLFLLGTDGDGRDLLSRLIFGTRLSLSIGLLGVALSFLLGIIIGGISGYFGGVTDTIVQRFIEILRAFPSLPLWMALSAALPANWSVVRVYFFITLILSILGWTGMARVVRGKFLAVREEAFVKAARLSGANTAWIIRRHLVPSFMSHIIAVATLSVPGMIIGETTLSFLGVGLRSPAISWGVLLQDAQQVQVIVRLPWMLLPAVMVVIAVLAFNFVGDGLRDAADPYL
ncbi:MAG: ABC transporter permease [Caldilineaceae bacterium]|nr:ABC transporter permease [Caldilineaceae bacterium]